MRAGSSRQLALYAFAYFALYAFFGVLVKVFQSPPSAGYPGQTDVEFLVYSTGGSALVCLGVIFGGRWWKASWTLAELLYILLAGTFTAAVIPTTKLMYSLPISVMVAMILMRGSIIVISRVVDSVLIAQGLSTKRVSAEENGAVLLAVGAIGINLLFAQEKDFDFLHNLGALTILGVYLVAYALRIYFMNYFKFTRRSDSQANKKNYFAVEQLAASFWIFGYVGLCLAFPGTPGAAPIAAAIRNPNPWWLQAFLFAGVPFGIGAFFSAFLFLFEGRTSTFSGLANRLSSLLAGTASTLVLAAFFGGHWPRTPDWTALTMVLGAVALLARAETKSPGG